MPSCRGPELDHNLVQRAAALEQVGHALADAVTLEDPGHLGCGPDDLAPDARDAVPRLHTRGVRTGARGQRPHDDLAAVGVEDHSVVGPRQEHVQDRQTRHQKGGHAEGQEGNQAPRASAAHVSHNDTTRAGRKGFPGEVGTVPG